MAVTSIDGHLQNKDIPESRPQSHLSNTHPLINPSSLHLDRGEEIRENNRGEEQNRIEVKNRIEKVKRREDNSG